MCFYLFPFNKSYLVSLTSLNKKMRKKKINYHPTISLEKGVLFQATGAIIEDTDSLESGPVNVSQVTNWHSPNVRTDKVFPKGSVHIILLSVWLRH